jgi:hypothetical protein
MSVADVTAVAHSKSGGISWKRLIVVSASFGAGFAIFISAIVGGVFWYQSRPRPWNSNALKASFETVELTTQPGKSSYIMEFVYNVENKTNHNYDFNPADLTVMANLTEGHALSKEFGHHQTSDPAISGPPFIPAQGRARISIKVSYRYPSEFTEKDKEDIAKIAKAVDLRLKELNGLTIFDKTNYYRVDLPEGWQKLDESQAHERK